MKMVSRSLPPSPDGFLRRQVSNFPLEGEAPWRVEAKRGVVTLYGKAQNAAEKNLATKLANDINGVKGVKGVKNRMTIE
jgi:osmotically-inducible protein OsmY